MILDVIIMVFLFSMGCLSLLVAFTVFENRKTVGDVLRVLLRQRRNRTVGCLIGGASHMFYWKDEADVVEAIEGNFIIGHSDEASTIADVHNFQIRALHTILLKADPKAEALRIAKGGLEVHSSCGMVIAELIGKPRGHIGAITVSSGTCAWCGDGGWVSTVLDYYESGYWD